MVRAIREATVRMDLERRGLDPNHPPEDANGKQELGLCVSLSVGELERADYQRFFDVGGHGARTMTWSHGVDRAKQGLG